MWFLLVARLFVCAFLPPAEPLPGQAQPAVNPSCCYRYMGCVSTQGLHPIAPNLLYVEARKNYAPKLHTTIGQFKCALTVHFAHSNMTQCVARCRFSKIKQNFIAFTAAF